MVLGWFLLKRGSPGWAGVIVGIATAIKLYPALLLLYFLFRHRRAFTTAIASFLGANVLAVVTCGWQNYLKYFGGVASLAMQYKGRTNLSLIAVVTGFVRSPGPIPFLNVLPGVAFIATMIWVYRKSRGHEYLDLEYSFYMVLMPLFSTLSWNHYLVLLVLPIAVLGKVLFAETGVSWRIAGYLALLLAFSVPDTIIKTLFVTLQPLLGYQLSWLVTSFCTLALAILALLLMHLNASVGDLSKYSSPARFFVRGDARASFNSTTTKA